MERPTSITFFSVVNILIALLGVATIVMSVNMLLQVFEIIPMPEEVESPVGFSPRDMVLMIKENPAYLVYNCVSLVWVLVKSIVLIAAAIGMFKLLAWARTATVVVAVLSLAFNLVNAIVAHQLVTLPMLERISEMDNEQLMTAIQLGVKIGMAVQVIPLVYYASMIFVLTRKSVVGVFASDEVQSESLED